MVHFLMSLNSRETFSHCLCLFFNELEFHVKTARSSRIIRMSHLKWNFFKALPRILSLCKLGNDQSYEFKGLEDLKVLKNKWSLFTCTPKGLHAPGYSEKFPSYQRLFYPHCGQSTSSAMSTEINKGEWRN